MMLSAAGKYGSAVLAVAALAAVGACSGSERSCTAMGAESYVAFDYTGVRVTNKPLVYGDTGKREGWVLRACVADTCQGAVRPGSRAFGVHQVAEPSMTGDPVSVTLIIRDQYLRTVFEGSTQLTPEKYQPNGAGCEPTAWIGAVKAQGRSELVATPVPLSLMP